MQEHVHRGQNIDARVTGKWRDALEQLRCVDLDTRGVWQDGVVHVDGGATPHVRHGRNLVHPLAVVALVVGRDLAMLPTAEHQRAFNLCHCRFWNKNIDIRKNSARSMRQACHQISGAFE